MSHVRVNLNFSIFLLLGSARFAANQILDSKSQKSGISLNSFFILVFRNQETGFSSLKIQILKTEMKNWTTTNSEIRNKEGNIRKQTKFLISGCFAANPFLVFYESAIEEFLATISCFRKSEIGNRKSEIENQKSETRSLEGERLILQGGGEGIMTASFF